MTPLLDAVDVPAVLARERQDEGCRWLGLTAVAALVGRARDGHRRFRRTGREELSVEDERLWSQLDPEFFAPAPDERLGAVTARLPEIDPGLG